MYIGWYYETLSGFRGSIDEIRIYNYALTKEEIKVIVGVEDDYKQVAENYLLTQNYPNPFNPSTKITYSIPSRSTVRIEIFNSLGQQVNTLVNEEKEAGSYEIEFDGEGLTSGVYYYQLLAGDFLQTRKMILLK
ncbi:MAG: T9SS type A sorting domain-containing protein [Ignavibacteriaceae bacterium]|nr:T9SS type A sorting domain-containing protein [Ignavibacteriaceae bacterium]